MPVTQSFSYQPLISIIVPVFNPPERYLRAAIESVINQTYPHWELCLADDASTQPYIKPVLEEYARKDARIKVVFRPENGHISLASNSAIEIATGEYIGLLDHDDLLTPDALEEVVKLLNQHPEADMVYSDENKIDDQNNFREPAYKPDWCPDTFLTRMYTCHFGVYRRSIINQIGGFRVGFEGSQDYDLVLRFTEQTDQIFHIPKILYHWRFHSESTAASTTAKPYAYEAALKAIQEALDRRGEGGTVSDHTAFQGRYMVRYPIYQPERVSIIILNRDQGHILNQCLASIFTKTQYPNYEVIVIDNGSIEAETQRVLRFWQYQKPQQFSYKSVNQAFNYSQLNNDGVTQATGEYLVFLNNDTQIITPDWLDALIEQTQRPSIGAVGGLLLYPNKAIQHAGFALDQNKIIHPIYQGIQQIQDSDTYSQVILTNNISAISGACLACRKAVFQQVGGFEENLPLFYGDVDLCLKIMAQGYHNIYLPHVRLYHQALASWNVELTQQQRQEIQQFATQWMQEKWSQILEQDPCFNPHWIRQFNLSSAANATLTTVPLKQSNPLVSICIPTYNGEKYLQEALDSILNQTYSPLEVIISDDGSTDNTLAIAASFQSKFSGNCQIFSHCQYGLAINWNYAISQAQGKYIKFLFQDDILKPNCIEELVKLAEQDDRIGLVFAQRDLLLTEIAKQNKDCLQLASKIKNLHHGWLNLKSIQDGRDLLKNPNLLSEPINKIGEPSTVLIRKTVFNQVGLFDSRLHQLVDLEMWFRIMGSYKIGFVDQSLSEFRVHPDQLSLNNHRSGKSKEDFFQFTEKVVQSSYFNQFHPQVQAFLQNIAKQAIPKFQPDLTQIKSLQETFHIPTIKSVISDNHRPFWSVVIPTYNGDKYIEQTLNSLLSQGLSQDEMEIIIVDDCSPNSTVETLVQQLGKNRVKFYRQPQNLGLIQNWNDCIQRSTGQWVHLLHQDDLVLPGFYTQMRELLEKEPTAGAAFCRHYYMDEQGNQRSLSALEQETPGIIPNWLEWIAVMQRIQFAAMVVKRSVYEQIGGFSDAAGSAADWEMWKRIAAFYPVAYHPQPLACYRLHSTSETSRLIKTATNISDTRKSIEMSQSYLPQNQAVELSNKAKEHYAFYALNTAKQLLSKGDTTAAFAQIQEALNCSQSNAVKEAIIQLFIPQQPQLKTFTPVQILAETSRLVGEYRQQPNSDSIITELRKMRQIVAQYWLGLEVEKLEKIYSEEIGKAHQIILNSGIKNELLTPEEQTKIEEWKAYLDEGWHQPKALQNLLALMLYCYAYQLPANWYVQSPIPKWFLTDYFKYMLAVPQYFQELGEADRYYRYLQNWLDYTTGRFFSEPNFKLWQELAWLFTQTANLIPLYFNTANLKNIYIKRSEMMTFALKSLGHQLDYQFSNRPDHRSKIRLGILSNHFSPQTETYSTLPVFEYLDRTQFEVILYAVQSNNHPLEQYCSSRVERFVKLPKNLPDQVQLIRNDDLDILLIGSNVTAVTHSVTLLALHRLARIQVTSTSSCVTTGMPTIDCYISGTLTEAQQNAQEQYSEKLILINGTAHCFSYYSIPSEQPKLIPNRATLGISDNAIVFISGANFYKIIPEVRETWAKILAAGPNSVLVLYPFNPNWTSQYAGIPFIKQFQATFAQYGVESQRLIFLQPQPSRADIKEYLKLADIYLDSYPFSGVNSLVDPLEVGLVPIVQDGDSIPFHSDYSSQSGQLFIVGDGGCFRSLMGASLLRSLSIPDLIANNEEAYIKLAVTFAQNPQLRQQKQQEIHQKMQQNPEFLESRSYSAKMGQVFQQLFQTWQQEHQSWQLDSREALQQYLSKLVSAVNAYDLDRNNQLVIAELRKIRRVLADFWLTIPLERLEKMYQSDLGKGYQILLNRGIQREPLIEIEQYFLTQLTQQAIGLKQENALNSLMVCMLYYPPGRMLVQNAETRLPNWLIKDYKRVFETSEILERIQPLVEVSSASIPVNNPTSITTEAFHNRLLGCVNLYRIDPTNTSVIEELQQIRQQIADFWLTVETSELASIYQNSVRPLYQAFLKSGFYEQPLTASEQQFLNNLINQISQKLESPELMNLLLATLLYCHPGQIKITDSSRLPEWFREDYLKINN